MTETKELRDEIAMLRGIIKKHEVREAEMQDRMSEMAEAIAKLRHRLDYYENPHSPPSQNSIPTRQRKAAAGGGSGPPATGKKAPGRKKGHDGVSHGRRPTRTKRHRPERCARCGNTDMEYGHARSKIITDLEYVPGPVTTNHLAYPAVCRGCGHAAEQDVPGIPGTCIGTNLATVITNLYSMPGSLGSVRTALYEIFGLRLSKAAVQKCLQSVSWALEGDAKGIEGDMSCSDHLHMDETPVAVDGRQGYVWIAVGRRGGAAEAVLVKVAGGRGGAVIDCHFPYGHIPVTVDGYRPYESRFPVLQGCWAHVLREARNLCGAGRRHHDLYVRLKDVYCRAKLLEPDPDNRRQYEGMVEQTVHIAGEYAASGCGFGRTLDRAAPNLFTFLLYPGMEPTNNLAERNLRPSVISRKIRHALKTAEGMRMFGVLMTCIMTWRARGQSVSQMIQNRLLGTMDACVGA